MKKILFLVLLSFSLMSLNVDAGIISKAAKGYVAVKVIKKVAPIIAKKATAKIAKKKAAEKLAKEELLKKELKVGKYKDLLAQRPNEKKIGEQLDVLDAHHIPSSRYISKHGIKKTDGVAIETQPSRHSQTRTYGNKDPKLLEETPREALGRDIKDYKKVFEKNGVYSNKVRDGLKKVILENKERFPNMYKKGD